MKVRPTRKQLDFLSWEVGMFFHFGIRTFNHGHEDWDGREMAAKTFDPKMLDCRQWMRAAKLIGAKYAIMTAKHHDGFAMYHSRPDSFNVVDATPYGRDVIAEIGEACYKYGLKLGLYYSQDLDWHERHGGGYLSNHIPCAGTTWDNSWDFPDADQKDYSICFENKIMPQIEELLTQYGELLLIWFDVPMTISDAQSRRIFDAVKRYQPNCLINSRLGGVMNKTNFFETGLKLEDLGIAHMDKEQLLDYLHTGNYVEA